jgi:hypothetical protein
LARTPLLALPALFAVVLAPAFGVFAACSSGGSAAPSPDGGDDATADGAPSGDDAADELVVSSTCGPPPWVSLGLVVAAQSIDNPDGAPLPGAAFTSPLCPGIVQYSDDAGLIQGQVSQNVPFYGRLQAAGYLSELAPEEVFDASATGIAFTMLPSLFGALIPGYSAQSTAILVLASADAADAGACSTLDGISFAVSGHPEAQVSYYSNTSVPQPVSGATATTARGLAAITGLAAGQFVTLTGTKAGCVVSLQSGTVTGRVPLETGFVSLMPAHLTP